MVKKWTVEEKKQVYRSIVFEHWRYLCSNHEKTKKADFDIIRCYDWATVLALTENNEVVLVRQYRMGLGDLCLELPGGVIHPEEDPLMAAQRELAEECGYTSNHWIKLGAINPNPAFMTNRCHYYLAKNARQTQAQELDPLEEIDVEILELEKFLKVVGEGGVQSAVVMSAITLYQNTPKEKL